MQRLNFCNLSSDGLTVIISATISETHVVILTLPANLNFILGSGLVQAQLAADSEFVLEIYICHVNYVE